VTWELQRGLSIMNGELSPKESVVIYKTEDLCYYLWKTKNKIADNNVRDNILMGEENKLFNLALLN